MVCNFVSLLVSLTKQNLAMFKRTKIVATVGPASETKEMLVSLAAAGVNVFRLNFSHGTHEDHFARMQNIRANNAEFGTKCAILQDLQGPKIRVGLMENGNDGVEIIAGNKLVFTADKIVGNAERVSTPYQGMHNDVKIGDRILMDDGNLEVKVTGYEGTDVVTEVVYGGKLKQKKGINLPNTNISVPSVTAQDWLDLEFGLANDVDWVALSFVRTADEIVEIQNYIKKSGKHTKVIAKIEKPEAIDNIDSIIAVSDAIMVARGDMGVELPGEKVPTYQKMIIEKCNAAAKPVIVATQMLESMISSPRATRAEVGDVANAVLDGADAVMLSAESASGKYPIEAVSTMTAIIQEVESTTEKIYARLHTEVTKDTYGDSADKENDIVVMTGCRLARDLKVKAITGITTTGYTAVRLSHHRPKAKVFVFSKNEKLLTQLSLYWGINAHRILDKDQTLDTTMDKVKSFLVNENELSKGDHFVTLMSVPLRPDNRTNTIRLQEVE
jgi:pyruvate kinase